MKHFEISLAFESSLKMYINFKYFVEVNAYNAHVTIHMIYLQKVSVSVRILSRATVYVYNVFFLVCFYYITVFNYIPSIMDCIIFFLNSLYLRFFDKNPEFLSSNRLM